MTLDQQERSKHSRPINTVQLRELAEVVKSRDGEAYVRGYLDGVEVASRAVNAGQYVTGLRDWVTDTRERLDRYLAACRG